MLIVRARREALVTPFSEPLSGCRCRRTSNNEARRAASGPEFNILAIVGFAFVHRSRLLARDLMDWRSTKRKVTSLERVTLHPE